MSLVQSDQGCELGNEWENSMDWEIEIFSLKTNVTFVMNGLNGLIFLEIIKMMAEFNKIKLVNECKF